MTRVSFWGTLSSSFVVCVPKNMTADASMSVLSSRRLWNPHVLGKRGKQTDWQKMMMNTIKVDLPQNKVLTFSVFEVLLFSWKFWKVSHKLFWETSLCSKQACDEEPLLLKRLYFEEIWCVSSFQRKMKSWWRHKLLIMTSFKAKTLFPCIWFRHLLGASKWKYYYGSTYFHLLYSLIFMLELHPFFRVCVSEYSVFFLENHVVVLI